MTTSTKCARATCTRAVYGYGYCREHAEALGLTRPRRPISELKAIVADLERVGWTHTQIAARVGMARRRLYAILHCQQSVAKDIIDRVAHLKGQQPPAGATAPAWPYARRVQSLRAAGHQSATIAKATGLNPSILSALANERVVSGRIHAATAKAIDNYWQKHYMDLVKPATQINPQWVTPLWWDNIDDPDEQPGITHCIRCHRPTDRFLKGKCHSCYRQLNKKRKAQTA